MIHSLAGGEIREKQMYTFCKVEITSGADKGLKLWYLSDMFALCEGDVVEVPLRTKKEQGKVVLIIKNTTNDRAPVPVNRAKYVLKKLN